MEAHRVLCEVRTEQLYIMETTFDLQSVNIFFHWLFLTHYKLRLFGSFNLYSPFVLQSSCATGLRTRIFQPELGSLEDRKVADIIHFQTTNCLHRHIYARQRERDTGGLRTGHGVIARISMQVVANTVILATVGNRSTDFQSAITNCAIQAYLLNCISVTHKRDVV